MRSTAVLVLVTLGAACSDVNPGVDAAPPIDARAIDGPFARCPLAVNEVAAAGDPTDWFELVNVSGAPVDLTGFMFIDEADDPSMAVPLPASILSPGARHVQEVTDGVTGFALGGDDALWLYRVGTTTACDGVDWGAGQSPSGGSFSRVPDGTGPFRTTTPDTRGVPNR